MKQTLLERVINAIADARNVEADALEIPLERYVSTEAIRELETHDRSSWQLEFELPDLVVTITENNEIIVDGRPTRAPTKTTR
jgi:hypothetical protein